MESSRSAKLIAGRVNCSRQIISLWCFGKVLDEIKPHNIPHLLDLKNKKKFRSNGSEFQPSFLVKLRYYSFYNLILEQPPTQKFLGVRHAVGEANIREQSKFYKSGNVASILTTCQFTNEPNHENIKGRFPKSWGLQASVSSSPFPSPFHLLCSHSNFCTVTQLEMLATQAIVLLSCQGRFVCQGFAWKGDFHFYFPNQRWRTHL